VVAGLARSLSSFTLEFGEFGPVAPTRLPPTPSPWTFVPSVALHALVLLLLGSIITGRPVQPRPQRSIDVELIDQQVYEDSFEIPPDVAVAPLAVAKQTTEPTAAPPQPSDGLTAATELFASRILADPQNQQVRDTLPLLEDTERIVQLCSLEGLEQLHIARPDSQPDSISPSAFAPTTLEGSTLKADGAAFRAAQRW